MLKNNFLLADFDFSTVTKLIVIKRDGSEINTNLCNIP